MIKRMGVFSLLLLLIPGGCGYEESSEVPGEISDSAEQMVELSIVGTIGVELGDSNYVLGSVQQIDHDLDGNILVLDRSACCVRVYSPMGEFIRQISNQGSGPGELLNPMSMTVVGDGRVFVETPFSGGMHAFTTEGEWLGIVTPFFNNPPMNTIGADSNAYVAIRLVVAPTDNGDLTVTTFIGRYEETEEPVVKYWEYEFPFDRQNLTELLKNTIMGHVFTADRSGNVFMAELTSEEYLVQGYRSDGELFFEVEKDVERVEKSAEEILDEELYVIAYLESIGAGGVVLEYNADPYRNSISEIEVDGEGRIWVRRGTVLEPVFDVYNAAGEELFTASVPEAGDDAVFWDFNIDEQGIIAYSINPELFQQIYILELSE
ncbi:MAG: 6-bladed beta-propeller [Candidatus Fermentibacteria bacterium]|nr:6-bladed beta-propeller [Candidatus Fermentibacteria bacterium]